MCLCLYNMLNALLAVNLPMRIERPIKRTSRNERVDLVVRKGRMEAPRGVKRGCRRKRRDCTQSLWWPLISNAQLIPTALPYLTACCRPIVAKIGDPVSILAHRYTTELFGYMIDQRSKEVDVLDKDIGILHPYNARTLELPVF